MVESIKRKVPIYENKIVTEKVGEKEEEIFIVDGKEFHDRSIAENYERKINDKKILENIESKFITDKNRNIFLDELADDKWYRPKNEEELRILKDFIKNKSFEIRKNFEEMKIGEWYCIKVESYTDSYYSDEVKIFSLDDYLDEIQNFLKYFGLKISSMEGKI